MDLGSVFLILALLILVALYISRPLLEHRPVLPVQSTSAEDHARSALLAARDRVLNALQELDFDFALGKIPEADYPAQRAGLLKQGASILRQLDELAQAAPPEEDADQRLEAAIAARRLAGAPVAEKEKPAGAASAAKGARSTMQPDDEIEILLANRRRARQDKAAGFCPKCGKPLQKSDRFCPKCGARLA